MRRYALTDRSLFWFTRTRGDEDICEMKSAHVMKAMIIPLLLQFILSLYLQRYKWRHSRRWFSARAIKSACEHMQVHTWRNFPNCPVCFSFALLSSEKHFFFFLLCETCRGLFLISPTRIKQFKREKTHQSKSYDLLTCVFPRLMSFTGACFELWLVHVLYTFLC